MKTMVIFGLMAMMFMTACSSSNGGRRKDDNLIQEQAQCRATRTCNR